MSKMKFKKISAFLLAFFILSVLGAALVSAQATNPGSGGGGSSGGGSGGGSVTNPGNGGGVTNPAPGPNPSTSINLENPFNFGSSLFTLLKNIIDNILLPIGGVLSVMGFIWTGFLFVKAQGKPAEIEKAKKSLIYTSIGTIILFGSWAIANVIQNTITQIQ
jgi:hypothetical protein